MPILELNDTIRPAVICAWCLKELKVGTTPVSHGICPKCKERVLKEANIAQDRIKSMRQYNRSNK